MTDDLTILASAYLDGQATPAERAQVESDSELLVEVERLRRVRSLLGSPDDIDRAPLSTRERHLAAALDAWDRVPSSEQGADATPAGGDEAGAAGGASITAPVPLRDRRAKRRPINTRILTAAAAVVVLAGAGLVVRGALDNSNTDESADTATLEPDSADDEARSLDVLAAEEFITEGQGEVAEDIAEEAAPAAAIEAEAVVSGGPEQAPASDDITVLSNNAELAEFANLLIIARNNQYEPTFADGAGGAPAADAETNDSDTGQATAPTAPPTLPPPDDLDLCGLIDDFVGFAFWEASGLFDDPIAVGIDTSSGEAVAYDPDSCTEIARTPLP